MKNLHLLKIFVLTLLIVSCAKDDEGNTTPEPNGDPGINATINGGAFDNYAFEEGVYQITVGTNGDTMDISASDINGEQITLFLNSTGGFDSGTVKTMGDTDSNNYRTYALIRQSNPQINYFSSTGNVTITENKAHPTDTGIYLISGSFNISASSEDDTSNIGFIGSFTDLEYEN